jgi:hypothetical protein
MTSGTEAKQSGSAWPLLTVSEEDLAGVHRRQYDKYEWNLSSERQFMENLFCQRFNFLLVGFSLVVTAAASANTQTKLVAVLGVGALITVLTSFSIWRAYEKLVIVFTMLYRLEDHPLTMVGAEHDARPAFRRVFRVNPLLGRWIPLICSLTLLIGFVMSLSGALKAT